ncbi:hypothetical protein [Paraburkholderia youngii]|uniref:hypothetical protein n=1 Tax=Paraburkholderia youngii TaxID=2782701 RepID=UPI003D1D2506
MSIIRSLTASVTRNVAGLKRDAKRLHKHSADVFGTQYPLLTCQRAMAVARGFKSLGDVEQLAVRLGVDRDAPFYTIRGRNDAHEAVLDALFRLQLELTEGKPVVLLGEQKHAILPALVLFLEQMSFIKRPGLILIETEAASRQDTVLQDAVEKLGVGEIVDGFRTLDLRDKNLPMSLSTSARWWTQVIADVLPRDKEKRIEHSGWLRVLERCADAHARGRRQVFGSSDFPTIPFFSIEETSQVLMHGAGWPIWVEKEAARQGVEMGGSPPKLQGEDRAAVMDLINALGARSFSHGTTCESESRWRPFVALFSRNDPASEVLAGVLHSCFYWRDGNRDRPILYVSDGSTPYAPRCLSIGDATAVVNGLTAIPSGDGPGEFYGYKHALKALAGEAALQYMGTRLPTA